jgi:hypothetical protein
MKLTKETIERNTHYSHKHYDRMKKKIARYEEDRDVESRKAIRECKACFYLKDGMALQAFTSYDCKECGNESQHHNSNVPRYCQSCADRHDVCVRCGSEV